MVKRDLFGRAPEKPEKEPDTDAIQKVAKALYAMIPRKAKGVLDAMRNEPYKRTMSDEYPFRRKPKPREPISEEQRKHWAEMQAKRDEREKK